MSAPALRQPKPLKLEENKNRKVVDQQLIILTLRNGKKLVVSSDALHGIIMMGEMYKCVFCNVEIDLNACKERHKVIDGHKKFLENHPYIEELSENLVRQIDKTTCYCTICNVSTYTTTIMRHVKTEEHLHELNKAMLRATTYKPFDENNNK
ncbi:unnamed protein product, partial [Brenthis ino]